MPAQTPIDDAPELPRNGPPPNRDRIDRNDPFGLRIISFRRYSVRHMSMLLLATLLSASVAAYSAATQEWVIAAMAGAGFVITATVMVLMIRMALKRVFVERWIRRLGMGDFEYTVRPWSNDELSKVCVALETLRRRAVEAMQLDEVRRLSDELQEKNQTLEYTLVELRNTQDQVVSRQKLAEIGELAAGIAHEVRNPLNIISSFSSASRSLIEELVETLAREEDDPELVNELTADLAENMDRIAESCDRASRIIQDVTNMSRSDESQQRAVDMNKMLRDYAAIAYQAARSQDQSFNVGITESMDPAVGGVMCVPEQISRVFINIVSNACYATNQKRLDPETAPDYRPNITLTTRRDGEWVLATVRDNGTGIPPETRDRIFAPFFTTKPVNAGTGLGLSLSHEIIRHHGGSIEVASELGQYTEIRIKLPTQPPASTRHAPVQAGEASPTTAAR